MAAKTKRFAEKPSEGDLPDTTRKWYAQTDPLACLPTSLKVALDDLGHRQQTKPPVPRLSVSKLNTLCGRTGGGVTIPTSIGLDIVANALDKELKESRLRADYSASATWDDLKEDVGEAQGSYPVVTLGPSYFSDPVVSIKGSGNGAGFHHSLLVVAAQSDVVLFDPLLKAQYPTEHQKYLVQMPRTRFLDHWETDVYGTERMTIVPKESGLSAF